MLSCNFYTHKIYSRTILSVLRKYFLFRKALTETHLWIKIWRRRLLTGPLGRLWWDSMEQRRNYRPRGVGSSLRNYEGQSDCGNANINGRSMVWGWARGLGRVCKGAIAMKISNSFRYIDSSFFHFGGHRIPYNIFFRMSSSEQYPLHS